MSFVAILAAIVMGFVLGILGGGGSILATPILLYLVDLPDKEAIATSLLVVGTTSLFATLPHAKAGQVSLKVGLIFGGVAMVGAYVGGRAAAYISGHVLLIVFAMLMLAASAGMLLRNRSTEDEEVIDNVAHLSAGMLAVMGAFVGILTGLVGVGGGFVIVPALVVWGRVPMRLAIGTSLAIIGLNSFSGLAGYLSHVTIRTDVAIVFTIASLTGALLGAVIGRRIDVRYLRAGFGFFVLNVGTFVFGAQLGWPIVLRFGVGILLTFGAWAIRRWKQRRLNNDTLTLADAQCDALTQENVSEVHE